MLLTFRADHNLAKVLISEFPCRPHWTKNSREILQLTKDHSRIDAGVSLLFFLSLFLPDLFPQHLARFEAVRAQFDPKRIFKSVVGETFGM